MKLFLKGDRCRMAKCALEVGRPAPGMHGQMRAHKLSDYGSQLREKQRLRRFYGLQEGQFRRIFAQAQRRRGMTGETLLQLLEMRLDNVVYRLGFAASRRAARQFVLHGHVLVDGGRATVPSMILTVGSVVTLKSRKPSQDAGRAALEAAQTREVSPWLALDRENLKGEVVRIPTRDEIAPFVNEQLVVELYSR
jgi:small subunit ribosomal protein S4